MSAQHSEFKILNLGAGVQSTTLALMSARGDIEKFDYAIFADTQEEPLEVYKHLDWLTSIVTPHFPVLIRTAGKLGDDLISGGSRRSRGTQGFASIPAFTKSPDGSVGMLPRQCTKEYKTEVVERSIRRDILRLRPGQRIPKNVMVIQYFGLSFDEPMRVIRVRGRFQARSQLEARFPLFAMEQTRRGCVAWLKKHFPERSVPRSACAFCPYKSNAEWRRIKEDAEAWTRCLEIDHALRGGALAARNMYSKIYLHRDCLPLEEVDLRDMDTRKGQEMFGFATECEGLCGV